MCESQFGMSFPTCAPGFFGNGPFCYPTGQTATTTSTTKPPFVSAVNENGCVKDWRYKKPDGSVTGPYSVCTKENDTRDWCMLPAYISGGAEGVAWKYTEDLNDPQCLTNWTYYKRDGSIVTKGSNITRTTRLDVDGSESSNRWCALRTYMTGGPENKAWKYC